MNININHPVNRNHHIIYFFITSTIWRATLKCWHVHWIRDVDRTATALTLLSSQIVEAKATQRETLERCERVESDIDAWSGGVQLWWCFALQPSAYAQREWTPIRNVILTCCWSPWSFWRSALSTTHTSYTVDLHGRPAYNLWNCSSHAVLQIGEGRTPAKNSDKEMQSHFNSCVYHDALEWN